MADFGEPLTKRENEILELVATGVTNREIAHRLHISVNTVKVHARNIFAKLGAESRTEATMIALREGLVTVPGGAEATLMAAEAHPRRLEPETLPPPLPWYQRVALVVAALLAAMVIVATWPRQGAQTDASLDPPPDQPPQVPSGASVEAAASQWGELAQMPTRRAYLALAAVEGQIIAIGGRTAEGISPAVEIYDPAEDIWARGADIPSPVANVSAAVIDTRIYVPGGCDSAYQPTPMVQVYDVQADTWRNTGPMPAPRCAYALEAYGGRIYLFGGRDGDRYVATTYVYDPASDEWLEAPAMSSARGFAATASLGGRIYVVGGYDGTRELTTCAYFDPRAESWNPCAPLTVGRGALGLLSLGNQLYAIGGGGWTSYLGFN
jgi:DNA-binding CsgD family transcriptional regulator